MLAGRGELADDGGYLYENTVYEDGSANESYIYTSDFFGAFYYGQTPTAKYVLDASYIKLRDLAISYAIPQSMLGSLPIQNATVSIVGHNLAILSKNVKHFDPEAVLSSGNNQGIESGAYPTVKTIGFSLKIGF